MNAATTLFATTDKLVCAHSNVHYAVCLGVVAINTVTQLPIKGTRALLSLVCIHEKNITVFVQGLYSGSYLISTRT